jgi:hypothetical protein
MDKSSAKDITLSPVKLHHVTRNKDDNAITPNSGHVNQLITCLRPACLNGAPKIYSEFKNDKLIVHNYGHGGGGWTFLWESIEDSIRQYEKQVQERKLSKDTPITIIGLGCMGLATAILLYERGFKRLNIIGEKMEEIASLQAGGYFSPSSTFIKSMEDSTKVAELTRKTFKKYREIVEGKNKLFKKGVQEVFVYAGAEKEIGTIETYSGMEELADEGLIPPAEMVNVTFGPGTKTHKMKRFKTFFVNPMLIMTDFLEMIKARKIPIVKRKISSFTEVTTKVIFNCTGLGSKELAQDPDVLPVLGHLITLKHQDITKLNYIIYTKYTTTPIKTPEDKEKAATIYFMPKNGGVVGGTYIPNNWGKDNDLNVKEFKALVERCQDFFGINAAKPKL